MATKKSTKSTKKQAVKGASEQRPAKRKKIVSLAEYEAQAATENGAVAETATEPATDQAPTTRPTPAKRGGASRGPSGLDAAVRVLRDAGTPLNCGDIVNTALEKGYWQTTGRTPASTIYAAIIREIAVKGEKSRFRKAQRGMFTLAS